jgi:hypothetical protein
VFFFQRCDNAFDSYQILRTNEAPARIYPLAPDIQKRGEKLMLEVEGQEP